MLIQAIDQTDQDINIIIDFFRASFLVFVVSWDIGEDKYLV